MTVRVSLDPSDSEETLLQALLRVYAVLCTVVLGVLTLVGIDRARSGGGGGPPVVVLARSADRVGACVRWCGASDAPPRRGAWRPRDPGPGGDNVTGCGWAARFCVHAGVTCANDGRVVG